MRLIKVLASTAVAIAVFCAGIGYRSASVVRGASDPPPVVPFLSSVAHDGSLNGDGTSANRLGIAPGGVQTPLLANGAVTMPKLGISGSPHTSDVLGFNGSGLAWQGAGGVRLLDSAGHSYPFEPLSQSALFQADGRTFMVSVVNSPQAARLGYAGLNCTGSSYLIGSTQIDAHELIISTFSNGVGAQGTTLYYPTGKFVMTAIESFSAGAGCILLEQPEPVAPYATIDLSSVLVPPFQVQVN